MSYIERMRNRMAIRNRGSAGPQVGDTARRPQSRMEFMRGDAGQGRPQMYGPAFGSTPRTGRVGGGNAGASTDAQWPASLKGPQFASGGGTGLLPGNTSTPMVTGGASTRARAVSTAAQNAAQAKVPGWNWNDHQAMRDAAMGAGRAAAQARGDTVDDKGYITRAGGGYLSGDALPATSDPSQDAYWARADMAAWAQANKALAMKQGWDPNRNYAAGGGTLDALSARAAQAPAGDFSGAGTAFRGDLPQSGALGAAAAAAATPPGIDPSVLGYRKVFDPNQMAGFHMATNEAWNRTVGDSAPATTATAFQATQEQLNAAPEFSADPEAQRLVGSYLQRIKAGAQR